MNHATKDRTSKNGIAIIGMSGRFPKAGNIDELWRNLCAGAEAISFFTDEELLASGVQIPAGNSSYVRARGVLDGADLFDASFFGYKPKEAEIMDPQHRVFLECAWEALESAGYAAQKFDGAIGVFAGSSMNTYLAHSLQARPELAMLAGDYQLMIANDKDFLPTRVSYKLNLRGPSLTIQTACSTSLVAVCVACQHLLNHQCDLALAGAVSIAVPQQRAYLYQEGGIASPDGHCRAFDAQAAGTVASDGIGLVVLRRLEDALEARDTIYAVIKGFALNNDGSQKIGFTAPSVEGQAEVIAMAQAMAGVPPESIGYVEAHGTGTPLGDPIEIEGLTRAFREGTDQSGYCAVGSVKTNIGHLDAAAGVAGLIKTALALHHRRIPASLNFAQPNPNIDFDHSPFYVNTQLRDWPEVATPRRAGVSSFGIGGTNAHVVLEEAPVAKTSQAARPAHVLVLSAKSQSALEHAAANLAERLVAPPSLALADVAYTLQVGRQDFSHRLMLTADTPESAASLLASLEPKRVRRQQLEVEHPPVVFLFPGQGAQHINMGRELYESELVFRETVDLCVKILEPDLRFDLRQILFPPAGDSEQAAAARQLARTEVTQPALFVLEYALSQLWLNWGIAPEAMLGHSVGEYVAACLAGVFALEDALKIIATRGRLMQQLPAGRMLAVRLPEAEAKPLLNHHLSLAAVNSAGSCVLSGPSALIDALHHQLEQRGIAATVLQTSHAFHSTMMEPVLAPFTELVRNVKRREPTLPFISNVTGTWISAQQATDPEYWATQLRQTVRFADGLGELLANPERCFMEVGPGHTLCGLLRQHSQRQSKTMAFASLDAGRDDASETESLANALGMLWLAGATPDWEAYHRHDPRQRVCLPTYPFERERFWVEPASAPSVTKPAQAAPPVRISDGTTIGSIRSEVDTERAVTLTPGAAADDKAERNGSERRERIMAELRDLFRELSGASLSAMDVDTTFTEMGFESLFLTQASRVIEKRFGVRVAFRQLLGEFSTLETLARHLESHSMPAAPAQAATPNDRSISTPPPPSQQVKSPDSPARAHQNNGSKSTPVPASTAASAKTAPLTEAQHELWYASQLSDGASCVYNESRLLHLHGALKPEALAAALQQVVTRQEALRTTFSPAGDFQRIHPEHRVKLPVLDWSGVDVAEQPAKLTAVQLEEARLAFDLTTGPLVRARLIRLAPPHHVLLLTVHHLICDGYALGVLLHELGELYSAQVTGASTSLPPPPSFSDYVSSAARHRQNGSADNDAAYWLRQFAGDVPRLALPTAEARPAIWSFAAGRLTRELPLALGQELKQLSAQQGCTLFATLLAAFSVLLRRLANQSEFVVGVPVAERAVTGGDRLIGHCINFLPLRLRVADEKSFTALLDEVQHAFLDAHEHQGFGFGRLLQLLKLPRDPSQAMPLASVTFNVERLTEMPEFAGLKVELVPNAHCCTNFDLNLNVAEWDGLLQVDCRYSTVLFSPATIQRWMADFQTLLKTIATAPHVRLAELNQNKDAPAANRNHHIIPEEQKRALSRSNGADARLKPTKPDPNSEVAQPDSVTEQALTEIWRTLLGAEQISPHDDFFELGGHSLLVTQVLSRVRDVFHVDVPLRRFFEKPTIAALALLVEEKIIAEIKDLGPEESLQHVPAAS